MFHNIFIYYSLLHKAYVYVSRHSSNQSAPNKVIPAYMGGSWMDVAVVFQCAYTMLLTSTNIFLKCKPMMKRTIKLPADNLWENGMCV